MKLNGEQIIKALECCNRGTTEDCAKCPRFDGDRTLSTEDCMEKLMRDALSLIKELTAKVAKWEEECDLRGDMWCKLNEENKKLTEENERLKDRVLKETHLRHQAEEMLANGMSVVRADTARKMRERLEELYTDKLITDDMTVSIGVIKQNIKDIAKEMLEGEK